jgi:hypothetical protein
MENKKSSKLEKIIGICGVAGCILLGTFVHFSTMPKANEERAKLEQERKVIYSQNYSIKKSTHSIDYSDFNNPASPLRFVTYGNPISIWNYK